MNQSIDDSQAGETTPLASLGNGGLSELAPGRRPAPGRVGPGAVAPSPESPRDGDGATLSTAGGARSSAALPAALGSGGAA